MENKVKLKDYFEFGVNEPKRRIAYNRDDVNFKLKIIRKMQELGMKITIDKIGNISGTLEGNNKSNKCILMASHTDSVKDGGQYDGPVGVISGLKVVEDIVDKVNRNEIDLDCNLKLVIWACEESERFGKACIGSKWVEGSLNDKDFTIKEVLKKPENEKRTLQEAVQEYITDIKNEGLPNIEYVDKVITMDEILKAYEIHIEQYQYLYENDIDIGIISSIVAPYRMSVEILGKDKIKSAANLVIKMNEKAKEAEKESKWCLPPLFRHISSKNRSSRYRRRRPFPPRKVRWEDSRP